MAVVADSLKELNLIVLLQAVGSSVGLSGGILFKVS